LRKTAECRAYLHALEKMAVPSKIPSLSQP